MVDVNVKPFEIETRTRHGDLVRADVFRTDAPLNKPEPSTFYGEGPKGYTDYPPMAAAAKP